VQIVSLALGLMALLVLTVVRGDLMTAWRNATPADAPNRFIINIQPDQKAEMAPGRHPRRRRRLCAAVPDDPRPPDRRERQAGHRQTYTEDRAKALADREFNLSSMKDLPMQAEIVAGKWYEDARAWPKPRSSRASPRPCAEAGRQAALRHRRRAGRRKSPACASSNGARCGPTSSSSSTRRR
jgi:putative ABC transport system permease protein